MPYYVRIGKDWDSFLGDFSISLVIFKNEFENHLPGVDAAAFPQEGEGPNNSTRSLSYKTGGVFSVILRSLTETNCLAIICGVFFLETQTFFCAVISTAIPHPWQFIPNNCHYYLLQWKVLHISTGMITRYAGYWKSFSELWTLTHSEYKHWLAV